VLSVLLMLTLHVLDLQEEEIEKDGGNCGNVGGSVNWALKSEGRSSVLPRLSMK
jgi:hypothetical protein